MNFWQPSDRRRAAVLEAGVPFLFKLHAPRNFIVGGGYLVRIVAEFDRRLFIVREAEVDANLRLALGLRQAVLAPLLRT